MGSAEREANQLEITMFTTDNTEGYTAQQLAALNAELAQRLEGVSEEERADVAKAFADEVAGR